MTPAPPKRIVVFVEGAPSTQDPVGANHLTNLWKRLHDTWSGGKSIVVEVAGFSKADILALAADLQGRIVRNGKLVFQLPSPHPLDVRIASAIRNHSPDKIIVAFDRSPPNQVLGNQTHCIRSELIFALENIVQNGRLDQAHIESCKRLLEYYSGLPDQSDWRPQHSERIEFAVMTPEFEGFIAHDNVLLQRAIGFHSKPKDWPWTATGAEKVPSSLLERAVDLALRQRVSTTRGRFRSNKHGWASIVVQAIGASSRNWNHPTGKRLKTLFTHGS